MASAAGAEVGGVLVWDVLGGALELGALDGGDVCCWFGGVVGAEPPDAFAVGASGTSFALSLFEGDAGVDPDADETAGVAVVEPLTGASALARGSEVGLELALPDGAEAPLAVVASNGDPSTPLPQPPSATTETQTQQNFRITTPIRGDFENARAADIPTRVVAFCAGTSSQSVRAIFTNVRGRARTRVLSRK